MLTRRSRIGCRQGSAAGRICRPSAQIRRRPRPVATRFERPPIRASAGAAVRPVRRQFGGLAVLGLASARRLGRSLCQTAAFNPPTSARADDGIHRECAPKGVHSSNTPTPQRRGLSCRSPLNSSQPAASSRSRPSTSPRRPCPWPAPSSPADFPCSKCLCALRRQPRRSPRSGTTRSSPRPA